MPLTVFFSPTLLAEAAAHPTDGWTNKEVLTLALTAVGGTLAAVVPVAWGLVRILTGNAARRAAKAEAEVRDLRKQVEELGDTTSVSELRQQLDEQKKRARASDQQESNQDSDAAAHGMPFVFKFNWQPRVHLSMRVTSSVRKPRAGGAAGTRTPGDVRRVQEPKWLPPNGEVMAEHNGSPARPRHR
jgi:hypothetical protein